MCAVSYFIVRFLHLQQLHLQQQHQQLQQQRRRPTLDLVAIAHVFLAEGVGGASIASGQSPTPKRAWSVSPAQWVKGEHRTPARRMKGGHESSDNPSSNQEAGGRKEITQTWQEEYSGCQDQCSAGSWRLQRGLWSWPASRYLRLGPDRAAEGVVSPVARLRGYFGILKLGN